MTAADVRAKQTKLGEIVAAIRTSVLKYGHGRFTQDLKPERANLDSVMPANWVALNHVLWMCTEIDGFIREQRWDKANRWIGFAQGVLWITGVASIDQSREINQ